MPHKYAVDFEELIEDDLPILENTIKVGSIMKHVPPVVSSGKIRTPLSFSEALEDVRENHASLFDFSDSNLTTEQQLYVIAYASEGVKHKACLIARVPYSVVGQWSKDENFRNALDYARQVVTDTLESELLTRAMNGSDRLLLEAVKARDAKYQPKTNVSGRVDVVHSMAELAKQITSGQYSVEEDEE